MSKNVGALLLLALDLEVLVELFEGREEFVAFEVPDKTDCAVEFVLPLCRVG